MNCQTSRSCWGLHIFWQKERKYLLNVKQKRYNGKNRLDFRKRYYSKKIGKDFPQYFKRKGHWIDVFTDKCKETEIDFTVCVEAKKVFIPLYWVHTFINTFGT